MISAVDALVLKFDKIAVIESVAVARTRDFTVGDRDDEAGVASVWGKLLASDAAVLDKKVAAMAATVCDADPRSLKERRADALGALANGNHHLPCACTSPGLPGEASAAGAEVLGGHQRVHRPSRRRYRPAPCEPTGTAILSGTEAMPTPLLAELLRNGAKLRPMCPPGEEPEPGYRPSAKLARHVRAGI